MHSVLKKQPIKTIDAKSLLNKANDVSPATTTTVKHSKKVMISRKKVEEIANSDNLLLIIIRNRVYDCTSWQHRHPGGHLTIRSLCGKDATDPFLSTHTKLVEDKFLKTFYYADLQHDDETADDKALAFRKLTDELQKAGWFETNYSFYYIKALILTLMFAGVLAGVTLSKVLWVHALSGVLLGLFWQQMAFIGHDLGHNGVTHNRLWDSYIGLIVGNFFTGISIGWWKRSHNVHHIVTNSCEHDPDIQHLPIFAVNPLFLTQRIFSTFYNRHLPLDKSAHLLVRIQHWLYYPVMAFARFNLYIQGLTHAMGIGMYNRNEQLWQRHLQILTLLGFWTWLLALTMHLPTLTSKLLFFILAHNVAGILHVQITLSHFCMPSYSGITYDDSSNGFIQTQLQGSLNIDCSKYMDWFHGGLQFQVEHHLWPRLPRHNLRRVRTLLEAFCKEHDLKYHHATFLHANKIMLAKLRQTAATAKTFDELFGDSANLRG